MLGAVGLVRVAGRGYFGAGDPAVWVRVTPGVGLAIVVPGESDFRELALIVVILPAVDLAVFIQIDSRAQRLRSVHVGPGVDDPVAVAVVGELGQLTGVLVVGGFGRVVGRVGGGFGAGRRGSQRRQSDAEKAAHAPRQPFPISSYRNADAMMPPWKLPRSSFSLGACAFSSGRPTPKSTDGSPRISCNVATTGIEPPSPLKTASCPKPGLTAPPGAWTSLFCKSVIPDF